jgi:hypothetical protein
MEKSTQLSSGKYQIRYTEEYRLPGSMGFALAGLSSLAM